MERAAERDGQQGGSIKTIKMINMIQKEEKNIEKEKNIQKEVGDRKKVTKD